MSRKSLSGRFATQPTSSRTPNRPDYLMLRLEPLEQRRLLAGNTVYVDDTWVQDLTMAADPGTLEFTDPVISSGNAAGHNGVTAT
jgi:hypothetical protein